MYYLFFNVPGKSFRFQTSSKITHIVYNDLPALTSGFTLSTNFSASSLASRARPEWSSMALASWSRTPPDPGILITPNHSLVVQLVQDSEDSLQKLIVFFAHKFGAKCKTCVRVGVKQSQLLE